jgi:P4 family phage/plasmid primase-like protien
MFKNNKNSLEILYKFMNDNQCTDVVNKNDKKNKRKKVKTCIITNTSIMDPPCKCNITNENYDEFLKIYAKAIYDGYKPHLVECSVDHGPLIIDIDLKYEMKARQYDTNHIINTIKHYNSVIKKYIEINGLDLMAYVLEKKCPIKDKGVYRDGIHIIYPFIDCTRTLQQVIRIEVLKKLQDLNIYEDMELINVSDSQYRYEDIIDKSIIKGNLIMYGSTKNKWSEPYLLTSIYREKTNSKGKLELCDINIGDYNLNFENFYKLVKVLSIRKFNGKKICSKYIQKDDDVEFTLLNFDRGLDPVVLQKQTEKKEVEKNSNYVEVEELLELLTDDFADDYKKWFEIGCCIYNVDSSFYDLFENFSRKCPNKFNEVDCLRTWNKMKKSDYSIATLYYYANKASPAKFREYRNKRYKQCINNITDQCDIPIAELLYEKNKYLYVCASIKDKLWFKYDKNRWIANDSAYSLQKQIHTDLVKDFTEEYQTKMSESIGNNITVAKQRALTIELDELHKTIKSLKKSNFGKGVMEACKILFINDEFLNKTDENQNLLCFDNGVFDFNLMKFRKGRPDDYITFTTGYNYVEIDEDDVQTKEIMTFFKQIQPDQEVRDYLLKILGSCLVGGNKEENFYILTGNGSNGKSKLMELIKNAFGNYYKPTDVSLFIGKRAESGAARPEIADKKGIRISSVDEPGGKDKINCGIMKILSGNDEIMGRALYKAPIYFKPQMKLFMLANKLPDIPEDDGGTWRRIKVIPFLSKFLKRNEKPTNYKLKGEYEHWADINLADKLLEWREAFICILIRYYKLYLKDGLVHPKIVTQYTDNYKKRCDLFQNYINDCLEKTSNKRDIITVGKIVESLRTWYKVGYSGSPPNINDVKTYFKNNVEDYDDTKSILIGYVEKKTGNINFPEDDIDDVNINTNVKNKNKRANESDKESAEESVTESSESVENVKEIETTDTSTCDDYESEESEVDTHNDYDDVATSNIEESSFDF